MKINAVKSIVGILFLVWVLQACTSNASTNINKSAVSVSDQILPDNETIEEVIKTKSGYELPKLPSDVLSELWFMQII